MTLILSFLTQEYVVQVSDRRLTDARTGQLVEDDSNKAVLFCGRMAFGYTGLAQLEGVATDLWLTKVLSAPECKSLSDAGRTIQLRATDSFRHIHLTGNLKRHAFVGVGWTRSSVNELFRPIVCEISNIDAQPGELSATVRQEFRMSYSILPESVPFSFAATGQAFTESESAELSRSLRRCAEQRTGPLPATRLVAAAIRKVAARNSAVGQNLLAVSIPRNAVGRPDLEAVFSPPSLDALSFVYLPKGVDDGIQYGPNVACGGGSFTNLQAGPV